MRLPVILGSLAALLAGIVVIGVVVAVIAGQPPLDLTLPPTTTPVAMIPTPSPTPEPTPTIGVESPTPSGGPSTTVGTQIGQRAPDFTLPFLAGGEISLSASAGKPVWVNFMATWCPPCEDELPMMQSMRGDLEDAIDFVLVDVGEDEETVTDFIVRLGVDLPIGLDQDASVQAEWAAFVLPVHYFLDGEGIVQEVVFGGAPRDIFEQAVLKVVPDAEFPGEP